MTLEEIIINLLIGLVSGVVSGFFVTIIFKKIQEKREWRFNFQEDKQNLSNFIYTLCIELDLLIEDVKNNNKIDVKEAKRVFKNQPRTLSFTENNITEESTNKLIAAHNLITNVEKNITSETILKELIYFRKDLFRARIDVLSLQSVKI
jgi:hypothetical protein